MWIKPAFCSKRAYLVAFVHITLTRGPVIISAMKFKLECLSEGGFLSFKSLTHLSSFLLHSVKVKAVQHQQKVSAVRSPVTSAKVKLDVDGSVGDTGVSGVGGDGCSAPPARRLHSAGSSPNSTPVRSAPRHPLLDEPLVGDLAPGGPPPPTSPSLTSPATSQPPPLSQTAPTSLLR